MTTPNHAVHTALVTHWATGDVTLSVALGIMGALPDLIPIEDTTRGVWGFYEKIHKPSWWMVLAPPYLLHIVLDRLIHDQKDGGWNVWGYVLEVLLWVGCIVYFIHIYKG